MTPRYRPPTYCDDLMMARRILDLEAQPDRMHLWLLYGACLLLTLACWLGVGWLVWETVLYPVTRVVQEAP